MNILFVSKLSGNMWAGPNNSVPARIKSQSKTDNILWINLNHVCLESWKSESYKFMNLDDCDNYRLKELPNPFSHPDFIVIEELYCYTPFDRLISDIRNSGVPYIIVPRSSMTIKAQQKHWLKKKLANLLFYNRIIKNAVAIQYLTDTEKKESQKFFFNEGWIIPNGTNMNNEDKTFKLESEIKAVFIGRIDTYQKGLDLLFESISIVQNILRKSKFHLSLFGPDRDNSVSALNILANKFGISDLITFKDPVFGEDKKEVLKTADMFIMTSRFEGLSMGLIEALSYGLPCLVTRGTYFMDEVNQFNAGIGTENSVDSISSGLSALVNDLDMLPIYSNNAKELSKKYSWDSASSLLQSRINSYINR